MYLYKFLNAEFGLKTIQERRIKLTRIMEANDPFEFLGLAVSNKEGRAYLNKRRKELHSASALLCLSADWRHPLMWAHYGDGHKGICLGFKANTDSFRPVTYLTRRMELSDIGKSYADEIDTNDIGNLLYSKFDGWAYEQEYRALLTLETDYLDKPSGNYLMPFNENLILKRVIVGHKSHVTRRKISNALGELEASTEAFKVRPAFTDFSLTRNLRQSAWK